MPRPFGIVSDMAICRQLRPQRAWHDTRRRMFRLSCLLAFLLSLLLLVSGLGYCSEPVRITVTPSFGPSQPNFQAIAQEISAIVADKFGARPPIEVPIQCVWRDDVPETMTFPGQIVVLLSAKDEHWAQFAFQLGHDLGHVYLGSLRSNAFIETLATAMSLEVLDELARRWATNPAIPGTSDWAKNFSLYRADNETIELNKLPEIKDAVASKDWNLIHLYIRLRSWDAQLTRASVGSEGGRALQVLAAMALRSQPVDWAKFVGFAHSSSTEPVKQTSGNVVYSRTRRDTSTAIQQALCRIGLNCPSMFLAGTFSERPAKTLAVFYQGDWYAMEEVDSKRPEKALNRLCKKQACLSALIVW